MRRPLAVLTTLVLSFCSLSGSAYARHKKADSVLSGIKTIYVEKLPNGLDQYIRVELYKQMNGRIHIVTDRNDADAVLTGTSHEAKGIGKAIGTYTGTADTASAAVTLMSHDGKTILWAAEAGDRSLLLNRYRRKGQRKVAARIVKQMKEAMGY